MLTTRVIPCLDIHDGRVVKGVQFQSLADAGDPVELAKAYDREGADEIAFLDISASVEHRQTALATVRRCAEQVFIPLTVAGGVRTVEDIRALLRAGADKVALNTAAVADPSLIARGAEEFGVQCIVISIDAKRGGDEWEVRTHGGRNPTGLDAVSWAAHAEEMGAGEVILTSIDRDGTKDGYDIDLLTAVGDVVNVPVIASGGAGTVEHFSEAAIAGRADAVLAASVFHYSEISIGDVKRHMSSCGLQVR